MIEQGKEVNKARAVYYAMFSRFFAYSADISRYFELLNFIDILEKNPLDDTTAKAFKELKKLLAKDSNASLLSEYDKIFEDPSTSTIRTTASFYDDGLESGKKRLEVINFLAKTKIRRDEKSFTENEDSIGFLLSFMAELLTLVNQGNEQYLELSTCVFKEVINNFIDEISRDIYEHENAKIFKQVIILLQAFMEFERMYLEVSKPKLSEKEKEEPKQEEQISEKEKQRRAKNKLLRAKGPKKEKEEPFIAYDTEDDVK